jgi:nucleotide-binding universal stress UspA family protein
MYETIVLAVDGSEESTKALPDAAQLAKCFHAEVIVVHVAEYAGGMTAVLAPQGSGADSELLHGVVRMLKDDGVSARGEIRFSTHGLVAAEIMAVAEAEGADLIVVGSRGLGELAGLLLGSVTNKLIHLADRPVLVVR